MQEHLSAPTPPIMLNPLLPQRLAAVEPVHDGCLSAQDLQFLSDTHRLPFGPKTWSTLKALEGEDQVIFSGNSAEHVSLEALNGVLHRYYRQRATIPKLSKGWHYTANSLTAAYELATGQLPHSIGEQQRSSALDGQPIVSGEQAYDYVKAFRLDHNGKLLTAALGRFGYLEAQQRYPHRLQVLSAGEYRVDDMIIERDPTRRRHYQGGQAIAMTHSEFAAALERRSLRDETVQPGIHYILQRYAMIGSPNGYRKYPEKRHPPEHERISDEFRSTVLGEQALARMVVRGKIYPISREDNPPLHGLLVHDLNNHYTEDFAAPIDALFHRDAANPRQLYAVRERIASTLNSLAQYEGDGSTELLLSANQAAALWLTHIEHGGWSALSIAPAKEVIWDDIPVTTADPDSVALFAQSMGYAFDARTFQKTLELAAGKSLSFSGQKRTKGTVYTDPNRWFTFSPRTTNRSAEKVHDIVLIDMSLKAATHMLATLFALAPSSHEIHVFGQYLKAMRQQNDISTL